MDDQKRFVLAMILSGLIMAGYYFFFALPMAEEARRVAAEELAKQQAQGEIIGQGQVKKPIERAKAIAISKRIKIDTPSISGSFQTNGMRFDDLVLKKHKQTIDENSKNVQILSPKGTDHAAEIFDNWVREGSGQNNGLGLDTNWAVIEGDKLTPNSPIILQAERDGFIVKRKISIDENYLITLKDEITNTTSSEINLVRKGVSRQYELPYDLTNFYIIQEGPIVVVDGVSKKAKYKKLAKKKKISFEGEGGWTGLTDRYWLSAAIAPQGQQISVDFKYKFLDGNDVYEAGYTTTPITISAGNTISSTGYIFAGAKVHSLLKNYTENPGISRLDLAVDYGMLGLLTKPMSWGLTALGKLTGNFGIGILIMTLIVKILLFPLNNKAYSSMAKMRAVQPKMKKIQERYADDRMKIQQELMALYRKEGVNPVAGCLPMIPQMFIFLALYKSLFITMEMRHAPFFGYLKDLSAREPISILNGFGAFPWDGNIIPFLALGPLALLYGLTMALMQTLSAPPTDKMQARIMQAMPILFMFILAPFAAGLLLYWVWNNILTIFQQYIITRKYKVHTPLDTFFEKITGKKSKLKKE